MRVCLLYIWNCIFEGTHYSLTIYISNPLKEKGQKKEKRKKKEIYNNSLAFSHFKTYHFHNTQPQS